MDQSISKNVSNNSILRTRSCTACLICGTEGKQLYQNIRDCLFGVSGEWNLVKCLNMECGLIWLDPKPIKQDIGKAYEGYYTHQEMQYEKGRLSYIYKCIKEGYFMRKYGYYTDTAQSWKKLLGLLIYLHPGKRSNLDQRIFSIPAQPHGKLLEVGCGDGQQLKYMQDLGWIVSGVDIDPSAVEISIRKGLQVHSGTLEDQEFPDNSYDVITSSHVIEHVYDPCSLLYECKRILKPGGRLVIVTPNSKSWGHKLFSEHWRGLEPPRHLQIFSPDTLTKVINDAGFSSLKVSTSSIHAENWYAASRSLKRKREIRDYRSLSLYERLISKTLCIIGRAVKIVKPDIGGEEIFLVAKK